LDKADGVESPFSLVATNLIVIPVFTGKFGIINGNEVPCIGTYVVSKPKTYL